MAKDKKAEEQTPAADQPAQTQEVALKEGSTELADYDFGEDAGAGMEDVKKDEFLIPFLRILQSNSPQVDEASGAYLPGAKASMILNTGTNELYDGKTGVEFVPVHRDHGFVEWTPRDAGGGFVGLRSEEDPAVLALRKEQGNFGKLKTTTGTEIVEVYSLFGLTVVDGAPSRVVVAFASTQIKTYRGWIGRVTGMQYKVNDKFILPPLWAHRWRLTTVPQQNKKGKFFGWALTLAEKLPDGREAPPLQSFVKRSAPLYAEGKSFHDVIKAGKAKVDHSKGDTPQQTEGDDIPF